ncbi:MAG: DNA helicase HerA-like ATPase [Gammaproteobacteria bacterium]|jgi:DNA helicase HerA-like ATPase
MSDSSILLGYASNTSGRKADTLHVTLDLKRANRHGLIAGATGTGKTVTLQALAESFSVQGVPVFLADVKGDISGISQAGKTHPKIIERFERLMSLNETQEGILNIVFALADEQGLLILDLKDLRSMLQHVGDNAAALRTLYGNVSASSVGAIQRRLLVLQRGGAKIFFGEPMLELSDLMRVKDPSMYL